MREVLQHTFPPFDPWYRPKLGVVLVDPDGRRSDGESISDVLLFASVNAHRPSFLNMGEVTPLRASSLAYSSRPAPGSNVTPDLSVSGIQSRVCINDCSGSLKFPSPACFNTLFFCLLLHLDCIVHPPSSFYYPSQNCPPRAFILPCGWK